MAQQDALHGEAGTVCAVVVTYRPEQEFAQNMDAILAQTDHAVVIRNGNNTDCQPLLDTITERHPGRVTLLENPENGLAKAQNIGIRHALTENYDWVLLMDDDSLPEAGMVEYLLGAYRAQPSAQQRMTGLIAPDIVEKDMPPYRHTLQAGFFGFARRAFTSERVFTNALYVCASGSLIPTRLLAGEVGMMDESYFIYYVDIEFCLRLRKKKYKIMVVRDARLHHRIGQRTQHRCLGHTISTTNHSPKARYYQFRNRIHTWKRYAWTFPGFLMFDYLRMNYEYFRVMFFEKKSREKLQYMTQGFVDGLLGKHGKKDFSKD